MLSGLVKPRHLRLVRGAQILLVLVALYSALSWVEGDAPLQRVGSEHLGLSIRAPVVATQGPWTQGQVITESSPGLPPVAPEADVTALYTAQGVLPKEPSWEAKLYIAENDGDAQWWSVERPLALEASGSQANLHLNVSAIVAEAQALEAGAHVPGQLSIRVSIAHAATVRLQGIDATATRTANLVLQPSEGVTFVHIEDADGAYLVPGRNPVPYLPVVAFAASALLEVALLAARKTWSPWERVPGLHPVLVRGLVAPTNAGRTDILTLLRVGKRTRGTIFVDAAAHLAVLAGPVALAAEIPAAPPPVETTPSPAAEPTKPAPLLEPPSPTVEGATEGERVDKDPLGDGSPPAPAAQRMRELV